MFATAWDYYGMELWDLICATICSGMHIYSILNTRLDKGTQLCPFDDIHIFNDV